MRKLRIGNYRQQLVFWASLGLLIRFLLMPIFAHADLIGDFSIASFSAFHYRFYPSNFGYALFLFHALILKIYSLVFPGISSFISANPLNMMPNLKATLSHPNVFRYLFLLKLPFLITEFACAFLFLKWAKTKKDKLFSFKLWMINPVMIFALYLFGKNEILSILFIILSFWYFWRGRECLSSFFLGLAITIRVYPVLFTPFFLLACSKELRERAKNLFLMFFPLVFFYLLSLFLRDTSFVPVPPLKTPPIVSYFFPAKIDLGHGHSILILPAILGFIYLKVFLEDLVNKENLWKFCYLILLVFFSLAFFHPQHFTWLSLFMIYSLIKLPRLRKKLLTIYALQVVCWLGTTLYFGKDLAFGLLAPIDFYLFRTIGSPIVFFQRYLPGFDPISFSRSGLAVLNAYIVYLIFAKKA